MPAGHAHSSGGRIARGSQFGDSIMDGDRLKTHSELGRRPCQPALPGKVDRSSGCGSNASNQAGCNVGPPNQMEGFLLSASIIDSATVQAYRETEYRVFAEAGFTLRVGLASAELLSAHKRHKTQCSAFLTACNPFSQAFDATTNAERQAALAKELKQRSLTFESGIGQHPGNGWPGEDSFLVYGLTLEAAKALGTRLEQNAFIWSGADAVPQLILLR